MGDKNGGDMKAGKKNRKGGGDSRISFDLSLNPDKDDVFMFECLLPT